ncbi:MAG: (2Fe-2S)-binding protein [Betaproteobacteria bacterium]|nr:(2Fe-2S)-binding protein [Betaproteobacteria bacterium]
MPKIVLHKGGQVYHGDVKENTNLVVRAGIRQFPYPNLSYGCGMGKCAKCASRIISGGEYLPEPNWKEKKLLGAKLEQGYRLACQLWINHDLELAQDDVPPANSIPAETYPCT